MAQLVSTKNLLMSARPLTVGVVSSAEMLTSAEVGRLSEAGQGCDLLELRLDLIGLSAGDIREAVTHIKTPLLLTARHPAEGGKGSESSAERAAMIEPLIDLAALIDIELRSVPEMRALIERARGAGVATIGSFHDFQATPSDAVLEGAIRFAENSGLPAVKIATYINTPDDLMRLTQLMTAKHRVRLSAMGMGDWGRVSRLLLAKCGSLLNYGFLGDSNAPGQWPAAQLSQLLGEI